jgi:putative ABC transport system ATP-binding protein
MASFGHPRLMLLDEHTAALDPKTAAKVMGLTATLVKENDVPTLMITHNMKDAIKYGNRLIMMKEGEIVYEAEGEKKTHLKIEDLVGLFEEVPE